MKPARREGRRRERNGILRPGRGRHEALRGPGREPGHRLRRSRARLDRVAHRPERRGQDDVLQPAERGLSPDVGESITFDGDRHLGHLAPHEIAELGIGPHLPEHPPLQGHDRARQRDGRSPRPHERRVVRGDPRLPGVRREEEAAIEKRAFELLELVGLPRRYEDELAKNLPYGDQRRLEVARAWPASRSCSCSTSRPPA